MSNESLSVKEWAAKLSQPSVELWVQDLDRHQVDKLLRRSHGNTSAKKNRPANERVSPSLTPDSTGTFRPRAS